jgi:phosphoglycolate phosphatase
MTVPPCRYRAVLFDLDGTLVDSIPFLLECFTGAVRDVLGHDVHEDRVRPLVGLPLRMMFERFEPALSDELADACFKAYRTAYLPCVLERSPLFPDALAVLDELARHNVALAVVTGKTIEGARRVLEPLGVAHRFGALVGADHGGRPKPSPDGALFAAELLGIAPEETIVVGDSLLDVEMALAAGMTAVGVATGTASRDELAARAHLVVDSLSELLAAMGTDRR